MRISRRLTAGLVTAAAAIAVLVPSVPAAATADCTARGSLPARVSLRGDRTVVTSVLVGTSGCHGRPTDNGASAYLYEPGGTRNSAEFLRWRHFGSSQTVTLYINLARIGKYVLRDGNVQLYDQTYRRVSWAWQVTTMWVKRAARIIHVSAAGGVVAGRAQSYTEYGWTGYHRKLVYVQRRPVGSSTWHTLGSVRPAANGVVRYRTATSGRYVYRLFLYASTTVWNTQSASVRG